MLLEILFNRWQILKTSPLMQHDFLYPGIQQRSIPEILLLCGIEMPITMDPKFGSPGIFNMHTSLLHEREMQ